MAVSTSEPSRALTGTNSPRRGVVKVAHRAARARVRVPKKNFKIFGHDLSKGEDRRSEGPAFFGRFIKTGQKNVSPERSLNLILPFQY